MALNFPANPQVGNTHVVGTKVYTWTGLRWMPGTTQGMNLSSVGSHVVPTHNELFDLGHSNLRWRDLYLSGNTIDLGGTAISSTANGVSITSAANVAVPVALNVGSLQIGAGANVVTLISSGGTLQAATSGNAATAIGGGGASVTVGNTAPTSPTSGSLWYDSDTGDTYVYYSGTWAEVGSGSSQGATGATGAAGTPGATGLTGPAGNATAIYDTVTTSTGYFDLPSGNTAQRPGSPPTGALRYNSTTGFAEVYTAAGWGSFGAQPPSISTVTPATYNGEAGTTFTINGANFTADAIVRFVDVNNVEYTATIVTYVNTATLTATTPQDFTVAQEPLDVKVIQASGQVTKLDCIDCGGSPTWTTASGSIGTVFAGETFSSTVVASDPDAGATISYSSSNKPAWLSVGSSTGVVTGTAPSLYVGQQTNNFDIVASDNAGNQTSRAFSVVNREFEFLSDGNDGNLTVAVSTTFNITTTASGTRTVADGVVYKLASNPTAGATALTSAISVVGLAANDILLVIGIEGSIGTNSGVGTYEFVYVSSVSGTTINLASSLTNSYTNVVSTIVQRVPEYNNVTVNGTLTASAWDQLATSTNGSGKYTSGILAIACRGSCVINSGGIIDANSLGYRSGLGLNGTTNGGKGESYNGATYRATNSGGTTKVANGGGGGGGNHTSGVNSGGGGGASYGTAGEKGYSDSNAAGGDAGATYGINTLATIFLGSGGGGGADTYGGNGGNGGGSIIIYAKTFTNNGTIQSNGGNGDGGASIDGGGGGSGGSVLIRANVVTLGTVTASGGSRSPGNLGSGASAGGYGGGGRVAVYYKTTLTGSVTTGSAQQPTYYSATYS